MPNNNITNPNALACLSVIDNAKIIGGKPNADIRTDLLEPHEDIQRKPNGNERNIAKHWNPDHLAPLIVSYHDGEEKFKVIDGQHRLLAAKMCNVDVLPCVIHVNPSKKKEAEIFYSQSDNLKKVKLRDSLPARLVAEEPVTVALKEVCDEFNINLSKNNQEDTPYLRALNSIYEAQRDHGSDCTRFVLGTIHEAGWDGEKEGLSKPVQMALISIWKKTQGTGHAITREQGNSLARKLRNRSAIGVIAEATIRMPRADRIHALTQFLFTLAREDSTTAIETVRQIPMAETETAASAT